MNRKNLIFVLLLDLIIVGFAISVLNNRYQKYKEQFKSKSKEIATGIVKNESRQDDDFHQEKIGKYEEEKSELKNGMKFRNISFKYFSSKAKTVAIIGDFNKWTPQELRKIKNNLWGIDIKLKPGEHTYNYLVDGKVILDPNNSNSPVENMDKGFLSSFIKVKPQAQTK